MAYNRREEDMFRYFISGLDQKMQAQLSLMFAHNKIMAGEEHRRKMEQMKARLLDDAEIDRIAERVLQRISIRIEAEAIEQLRDLLNSLGQ